MHAHLHPENAKNCFLGLGRELFRAQGLVFGLTVSPQKFQRMNSVLVNVLLKYGHSCLLYFDDRKHPLPHVWFYQKTLQVELYRSDPTVNWRRNNRYYLSVDGWFDHAWWFHILRQELLNSNYRSGFSWYGIEYYPDYHTCPSRKALKNLRVSTGLQKQPFGYDVKYLERLRGKAISWLIVVTSAKLFIREMNSAIAEAYANEWCYFPRGYLKNTEIFREIDFWVNLTREDLVRPWHRPHHGFIEVLNPRSHRTLYTDAFT